MAARLVILVVDLTVGDAYGSHLSRTVARLQNGVVALVSESGKLAGKFIAGLAALAYRCSSLACDNLPSPLKPDEYLLEEEQAVVLFGDGSKQVSKD